MSAYPALHALKRWKRELITDKLIRPVAGIEAEFSLIVDGQITRPEDVFGDPRGLITGPLMHRTGKSFQLPSGAAVYFDTGVIEVATPIMELERGCFGRLARSLDGAIHVVRRDLDRWERKSGRTARLQGFSTHYNVSVDERGPRSGPSRRVLQMAWLLAHILPAPVMLLATNRRSTGVGVRPRPRRIEITADFPPDANRLAAAGAVIGGIVRAVGSWRDLRVESLRRRRLPVVETFVPMRHTSRRGWLARFDCYPVNPFTCDPNAEIWDTTLGRLSLRAIAARMFDAFGADIRRLADEESLNLASRLLSGESRAWLDEADRPAAYDDVGRPPYPASRALRPLGVAAYEQVVLNVIARKPLVLDNDSWTPIGVRGWFRIVLRRDRDGARTVLPLETLASYLNKWGQRN